MPLLAIVAALGSALIHASWNAALKAGRGDRVVDAFLVALGGMLLWAVVALIWGAPAPAAWPYIAASVVIHLVYWFALFSAYDAGDMSHIYTLSRGVAPMLVALGAALTAREIPSSAKMLGVALVSVGVLGVGLSPRAPLKASLWALSLGVCISSYSLVDALGTRRRPPRQGCQELAEMAVSRRVRYRLRRDFTLRIGRPRRVVSRVKDWPKTLGVLLLVASAFGACRAPDAPSLPARRLGHAGVKLPPGARATDAGAPRVGSPEGKPVAAGGWESVVTFPELVAPELSQVFEQWRKEADPAQWFLSHPETPPQGFKQWPARSAGPFPGRRVLAKVVAHRFAGDRYTPYDSLLDVWVPGCGGDLLDRTGARCPSVSYPGRELSDAQRAELVAIANTPNDVQRTVMSGENFKFGFLFFGEDERPFAQMLVDASVMKIWLSPQVGKDAIDTMMPARRERLGALLAELELFRPESQELRELLEKQYARDGQRIRLRYLPARSGVPLDSRLGALSERQKLALCFWRARTTVLPNPGSGFTCENGPRMIQQNVSQCVDTFPSCDVSVGDAEQCERRQRVDRCFERPERELPADAELPVGHGRDAGSRFGGPV
jgi:uncharacterized membrane protein